MAVGHHELHAVFFNKMGGPHLLYQTQSLKGKIGEWDHGLTYLVTWKCLALQKKHTMASLSQNAGSAAARWTRTDDHYLDLCRLLHAFIDNTL